MLLQNADRCNCLQYSGDAGLVIYYFCDVFRRIKNTAKDIYKRYQGKK